MTMYKEELVKEKSNPLTKLRFEDSVNDTYAGYKTDNSNCSNGDDSNIEISIYKTHFISKYF